MTVWVIDAQFHLANALRSVGVGLATAAWVSVLTAHIQLPGDVRIYVGVGLSLLATALAQLMWGRSPPSGNIVELLRTYDRDILLAAREASGGNPAHARQIVVWIAVCAAESLRREQRMPADQRAWFRCLGRQAREARDQLQVH
jgi:hypothetical protein